MDVCQDQSTQSSAHPDGGNLALTALNSSFHSEESSLRATTETQGIDVKETEGHRTGHTDEDGDSLSNTDMAPSTTKRPRHEHGANINDNDIDDTNTPGIDVKETEGHRTAHTDEDGDSLSNTDMTAPTTKRRRQERDANLNNNEIADDLQPTNLQLKCSSKEGWLYASVTLKTDADKLPMSHRNSAAVIQYALGFQARIHEVCYKPQISKNCWLVSGYVDPFQIIKHKYGDSIEVPTNTFSTDLIW